VNYYTDTMILNDLLLMAGAIMVADPAQADIDLSPEEIDKSTIIGLLAQKSDTKLASWMTTANS
jgi:hypothetical protein